MLLIKRKKKTREELTCKRFGVTEFRGRVSEWERE